ncbi:MAG: glucose-6-phosphate isomerase, partial [Candidatus Nanopelagicaceae bacterium]
SKIIESWQNLNIDPVYENEHFEIYSSEKRGSTSEYLESLAHGKYLSIMAYLNRNSAAEVLKMRQILERALGIPTTFGWGPRFLHSTGQFHKGGPLVGSFLQITNTITTELPIPGVGYGFERLVIAQALGDYEALATRKLPVVRINLKSQAAGINQLIEIGKELIKSS